MRFHLDTLYQCTLPQLLGVLVSNSSQLHPSAEKCPLPMKATSPRNTYEVRPSPGGVPHRDWLTDWHGVQKSFLGLGSRLSLNSTESTSLPSYFLWPILPSSLPYRFYLCASPTINYLYKHVHVGLCFCNKSPNQKQCVNPGGSYPLPQIPTQISFYYVAGKWNLQISVSIHIFSSFLMKGIMC